MTYKDHGKVAEIFRKHLEDANGDEPSFDAITGVMEDFASYAERDNPRFDRDKFYIACGIGLV